MNVAIIGALLHDIGKVVQRAGGIAGNHSDIGASYLKKLGITDKDILDCVKFHHGAKLKSASNVSDMAYIAYIADNIAAATERRPTDRDEDFGFDAKMPLQTVFNLMRPISDRCYFYRPVTLDSNDGVNYPQTEVPKFDDFFYKKIVDRLSDNLRNFDLTNIGSFFELAEATLSFVPSSTNKNEVADISLYDHMKLTAAVAGCIYSYLEAEGITDFKKTLFTNEKDFHEKDFAILYSADVSGIQDFIYTIHSANALKTLRARSFYLELFVENLIDEVLESIGLTRANLLYAGGGHFYMLLPNTATVKEKIAEVMARANSWLTKQFRTGLYIADGYAPCSSNALQNKPSGAYSAIFKEASRVISAKKLHRYSAGEIMQLNNKHADGQECRICKIVAELSEGGECELCAAFIALSGSIVRQYDDNIQDAFFVISPAKARKSVPIFEGLHAFSASMSELMILLKNNADITRYYGKNAFYSGKHLSAKLWVGDYCKEKELSKYAEGAEGLARIGILRMDVDWLGQAFTSGFTGNSGNADEDGKYNTLSRTATFSRQLSMFFKRDINRLLHENARDITIVYSGGDDMFLVGAWDDVVEAAADINTAFERYTTGKLTLSAGLGLYPGKYPIHVMARETGELESCAKSAGKNAVSLFTPEFTFSWADFSTIKTEKLALLEEFFGEDRERGNSFLYQLLEYIRSAEAEASDDRAKISLARYAYLLARAEPPRENAEKYQLYTNFSKKMYEWINQPQDALQLKAAIHLYVYSRRVRKDGSHQQ